ncbi:hypothetical protein [Maribacter sp. 2-571]|uniref:hypothetical protein n=1 Tax=Maribacter sp. 2-571 TaxID=3417569 RepID=UPI003D33C720
MKQLSLLIIILIAQTGFAQNVDFDLIKYNGLDFLSSRLEITKTLGSPNKEYAPNYDCGFLSIDEQGIPFITLDFKKIKFTGTDKQNYLIEEVIFENDNSINLSYGEFVMNCETDSADLIKIFGDKTAERLTDNFTGGIVIFHAKNDDGIRLQLRNGKLIRWQYYSPC